MHKRMTVDPKQQHATFIDYADFLGGLPEYAIALAVIDYIENEESEWFPTLSKLKKKATGYVVSGVYFKNK